MKTRKALGKAVLIAFLAVAGAATAGDEPEDDYQALGILSKNCAGCHQDTKHPGALFLKRAALTQPETIALVLKVVETSKMPPAHAKFRETADGKTLIAWLR